MGRIAKIAEKAGVSAKTVSRFLNGHPNVSLRTRRRIESAVSDLRYGLPAGDALSLTRTNRGIGALFGDPTGGYQESLYGALLKACPLRHFLKSFEVLGPLLILRDVGLMRKRRREARVR